MAVDYRIRIEFGVMKDIMYIECKSEGLPLCSFVLSSLMIVLLQAETCSKFM